MNKALPAILKILCSHEDCIIGSREIARQLRPNGFSLSERTVRYYLKLLDEQGFTDPFGKEGRRITEKGKQELSRASVTDKLGFVITKIDALSFQTGLDLATMKGRVILNVSYVPEKRLKEALKKMKPVFASPYVMSDRVVVARGEQMLDGMLVPEGRAAIGTVCSVTVNGIFLKAGIPVSSRFGGLLEIEEKKPKRFVSLISYDGSSLDPLEVFIRSRMTEVSGALGAGAGRVLASFREIPTVCVEKALQLSEELKAKGIRGILKIGRPNNALYEVPVGTDRAGMVIVGGLNPIAALQESGVPTESKAMSILYEYSEMKPYGELIP